MKKILIGVILCGMCLGLQANSQKEVDKHVARHTKTDSKPSKKCINFAEAAYGVMQKRQKISSATGIDAAIMAGSTPPAAFIDHNTMLMVVDTAFSVQKYNSKEDIEAASQRYKTSAMKYCRENFE